MCVCVCVCVCVFGGISKPRSRGGRRREAVAVMQRRLFINHPPSLCFSPSFLPSFLLSFIFPSSCLHPASLMSNHHRLKKPSLPADYDNAAVFLLIGRLSNCDRWLLLQRGHGEAVSVNTQSRSCTANCLPVANCGQKLHAAWRLDGWMEGAHCQHFIVGQTAE